MAIPMLDKHMTKSVCRLKLEKMPSRDIDVAVRLAEIRKIQVIFLNIDNIIFGAWRLEVCWVLKAVFEYQSKLRMSKAHRSHQSVSPSS